MAQRSRRNNNFFAAALLLILTLYATRDGIFRQLWFDEALTVMNFMALPGPLAIYRNYVIPNNHIVYTVLLKLWAGAYSPVIAFDVYLRLFSLGAAVAALAIMFFCWKQRCGVWAVTPVCACLALSLPFGIYAVAVRGYMLSFLLTVLALELARRWIVAPDWRSGAAYCAVCLLAVGAIPSNIIALGAVALYFAPFPLKNRKFVVRFLLLAAAPPLLLAAFYLPLAPQVAKALALKEGWADGLAAMAALYAAWGIAFFPAIFGMLFVAPLMQQRAWHKTAAAIGVMLLPAPFFLFMSTAPFPRVFFPLWAVWMYLLCRGWRHLLAWLRIKKYRFAASPALLTIMLGGATLAGGLAQREAGEYLSAKLIGGRGLDDFFRPYHVRESFSPFEAAKLLQSQGAAEPPARIYVSFNADPYSMVFYGKMLGIPSEIWLFDSPRGRVRELEANCARAVLTADESESAFTSRFPGKQLLPLSTQGFQRIYQVTASAEPQN